MTRAKFATAAASLVAGLCLTIMNADAAFADIVLPGDHRVPIPPDRLTEIDGGVNDLEAIVSFAIPKNWEKDSVKEPRWSSYSFTWRRQTALGVYLAVEWAGRSRFDNGDVKKTLSAKPHTLSSSQLKSIQLKPVNAWDAGYIATSAQTKDIDGLRVLIVKGTTKNKVDAETIYIPTGGEQFQEVSYFAPQDKFSKFHAEAQEAFDSLKLRTYDGESKEPRKRRWNREATRKLRPKQPG
jgi:hypothetical protein